MIDGTPAAILIWGQILSDLENHTYKPTPDVDTPTLHAPFSDANLRMTPPRGDFCHPQPIVSEQSCKRFPRTLAEARPPHPDSDEELEEEDTQIDPAMAKDSSDNNNDAL